MHTNGLIIDIAKRQILVVTIYLQRDKPRRSASLSLRAAYGDAFPNTVSSRPIFQQARHKREHSQRFILNELNRNSSKNY